MDEKQKGKYGKEKRPEVSLEMGKNLSDEEAIKQGSELRRKGNVLLKVVDYLFNFSLIQL
jgi:hypothetical protein